MNLFLFSGRVLKSPPSPQVPAIVHTALQVNGNVQNVINVFNIIPRITMSGISCWYFTWIWTCCLWRRGIQIHPNTASTIASCRSNRQAIRGGSVRPPSKHLSIFHIDNGDPVSILHAVHCVHFRLSISGHTSCLYPHPRGNVWMCSVWQALPPSCSPQWTSPHSHRRKTVWLHGVQ